MAPSSESDVRDKLAVLQNTFKQSLSGKLAEIVRLRDTLVSDKDCSASGELATLHRMIHSLAGSGGTFGAISVSKLARELEQLIKPLMNEGHNLGLVLNQQLSDIDDCLARLTESAEAWQPSSVPYIQPEEPDISRSSNLIYLAEDDEMLAENIITLLKNEDYEVRHFSELNDFKNAFSKEIPGAIIMDMIFHEGGIAGAEVIKNLQNKIDSFPPVIFISVRDDIEARLAAARAGASRYFTKPVKSNKLLQTLNGLTSRSISKPFSVLLIDDDEALLEFYAAVLKNAGMLVKVLSDPLQALELIRDFKPDIVVLDVYMPGCTGPELAQVIRQDDKWAQMPIMFLSTESDISRQLTAMNLGGDDFLVKPVEAGHLVSAVTARANRARWITRLNNDLKNAIRENKFQLATMDQHDIVSIADVSGRITSVNDKFCEISGYTKEELLGQNHRILKSGLHPDSFYEDIWNTISVGKIWRGEICNRSKEGMEYWVESTIVPFLDDKGLPYKYVSARTDITTLRLGEERLSRSQEFANIGTWDWNITTGELYWSERIWPLFGYEREITETTYENFLAAIHPEDQEKVMDAVNNCVEKGSKYNIEHRVVWPDGSVHWVQESGDVVRDVKGIALHMLGVVQDINDRKQSSLALIERERQLQEAQSMAHIGNWTANFINNDLHWSDEIYRIFGYTPQSFEPSVDAFRASIHPDDLELVSESEKLAEQTGIHNVIHRIVRPDGSIRHVHELAKAEFDAENNLIGLSGTVQDITESIEAKEALIQAREEAEDANRAKSQFLSSMSHELRTPLNAIIGFGQLMQMDIEQSLSDSQKENINEILKGGHHLLQLINEVLDLAKIEAGRIDLSMENVVLGEIISEAMQLIYPMAQSRGIQISIMRNGVDVALENLLELENMVWADHTRLKQVIINLLSNAVKYNSENGKIIISCSYTDENLVRVNITDTGPGLNQQQQSGLFKAFNRLGAEHSDVEGTGIGLVITQNIIELMGGKIGVESKPGVGSTFWIDIVRDGSLPVGNKHNKQASPVIADMSQVVLNHTILYIEDNPANLRLVSQLLGRIPDVRMQSAHEPLLGLELATRNKPDLILLDINLPGIDGFEVLKLLRQREATRNIPVVAISANAMPRDIQQGKEAGFDDYITKPIDVKLLLKVVEEKLLNA